MNQTGIKRAIQLAAVIAVPIVLMAYHDQPPAFSTGAPGDGQTCTGCHRVTAGTGNVQVKFPGALSYTPGVKQSLQVVITDAVQSRWGFELTSRVDTSNGQAGTFTSTDNNTHVACGDDNIRGNTGCPTTNPLEFMMQTANGSLPGTMGSAVYSFDWTPPATNVGNVTFYVAALAANNNNSTSGDTTYTANVTLTPAAAALSVTLTMAPASLAFGYQIGGAAAAAQTVALGSSGAGIAFTSSVSTTAGGAWLAAGAAAGTTPASLSVSVNPTGLLPGTYTGSVTINAPTATNSSQTIPVTFTVAAPVVLPTLSVSPAALTFSAQSGSAAPAAQAVSVGSTGAALSFTAAASAAWLKATPVSGTSPASISISVNQAGLAAGTYNGTVTVSASGAANSSQSVAVTLTVSAAPTMTVSPATLSFSFQTGGAVPAAQTISVAGAGLSYTVAASGGTWLTATPASGSTPGSVSVSVNTTGMTAGTYNGTVAITAAGAANSPQTVAVTLTVTTAPTPTMTVSPTTLSFSYQSGGAAPPAKTVAVAGTGLSYTVAASGGTWLTATPASGSTPGSVSVSVNPAGMTAGTYNGTATIAAAGAANSPQTVTVTLTVTGAPTLSLQVSPATLSFAYATGGTAPAAKTVAVAGAGLSYTVAASGGSWLTATPASGSTPGSVSVSVNPAGMAAGTYQGSVAIAAGGAANTPQTVAVSLVVSSQPTTSSSLRLSTRRLSFGGGEDHSVQSSSVKVTSRGAPLTFTASPSGGNWLSVSQAGGTTPAVLSVSANRAGLASGSYSGVVTVSAGTQSASIAVTLSVGSQDDGEHRDSQRAIPVVTGDTESGLGAAQWVGGAGMPASGSPGSDNSALLLLKSPGTEPGAIIDRAEGLAVSELGFDLRGDGGSGSPRFRIVTGDGVEHLVGGLNPASLQPSPADGWTRWRFDPSDPAQASPQIMPGQRVKSIRLVLDGDSTGPVVVDNISINGKAVSKQ